MSSPAVMPRCARCGTLTQPGVECGTCGQVQGPVGGGSGQFAAQYPMDHQAPHAQHYPPYAHQHPQYPMPMPHTVVVQAPKSGGIAVLLNFIVLGGGHLYLNKVGVGIALICWEVFLFLLLLIPIIGWVGAPLLWLVTFGISSAVCVSEANAQNRALYGQGGYR